MTHTTCGICHLVYIKPDYVIIFFYNIRTYYIYLLILSKLRSRRKDVFQVSNTYLSIEGCDFVRPDQLLKYDVANSLYCIFPQWRYY